jgi:hypothetical protein
MRWLRSWVGADKRKGGLFWGSACAEHLSPLWRRGAGHWRVYTMPRALIALYVRSVLRSATFGSLGFRRYRASSRNSRIKCALNATALSTTASCQINLNMTPQHSATPKMTRASTTPHWLSHPVSKPPPLRRTTRKQGGLSQPLLGSYAARITTAGLEREVDRVGCFMEHPEGEDHPKHVEEDQIHPEVHEIRRVQVLGAGQPLGCKRHEAWRIRGLVYFSH